MHAIHYEYAPRSFANSFPKNVQREVNYELRNTSHYIVPAAKTENFKKFPLYTFPKAWNDLGDLSFQRNKRTFQIALKNYLLETIV